MNVGELRRLLEHLPDDCPVVVDGYEGGITDPARAEVVTLAINVNSPDEWWYGPHEEDEPDMYPGKARTSAFLISRMPV